MSTLFIRMELIQYTHAQCARDWKHKKIALTGTVIDVKQNSTRAHVLLQAQTINEKPVESRILLHWPYSIPEPMLHDTITLQNITLNFGKDGYLLYLYKENICATAHVAQKNITSISSTNRLHENHMQDKLAGTLTQTILLGKKINNALYTHIKKIFNWWGIRHYLARSGLHFSILFFLILFLLSYLPAPWYFKQIIISLICITLYTTTFYSVSFLRAFIFYLLITTCNFLYIRILPLHLLNITFCCILLYNPFTLCFLDFQLTFCATYLLLWLNKIGIFTRYS